MADEQSGPAKEQQLIEQAKAKGRFATAMTYFKLSGPGWLQSAITLGGGSLSSSLYLGVLAGFSLLWLQPAAMIIGIVMLSAIGYVALSTGEKPFRAINEHVSPVLGWGWLIATVMANCIWSLPQFALAARAFRQNLMPGTFGLEAMGEGTANFIIVTSIAVICIIMVFFYDSRGPGVKIFNVMLKLMVGVIVVSFFGVVVYMSVKGDLPWGEIGSGFIPNFRLFWEPADKFSPFLAAAGKFRMFWTDVIVTDQTDTLIAAAATAVGINMTFLLPYSMLKRGWNKHFRGLAVFDLSTGLFIPFILATGCVVIASASQFHTKSAVCFPTKQTVAAVPDEAIKEAFASLSAAEQKARLEAMLSDGYEGTKEEKTVEGKAVDKVVAARIVGELAKDSYTKLNDPEKRNRIRDLLLGADGGAVKGYRGWALKRIKKELGNEAVTKQLDEAKKAAGDDKKLAAAAARAKEDQLIGDLSLADRRLAGMLVRRDNIHLAKSLSPLIGRNMSNYVFGIGVVGMAVSSIIILMLINGFCLTEIIGIEGKGLWYRLGCLVPAVGMAGPFIWKGAAPYLALPTSVFGFILIPIAYTTFMLVLNSKSLLGDNRPKGAKRWIWNVAMIVGLIPILYGSVSMAWKKTQSSFLGSGWFGVGAIMAFVAAAVIVHFIRRARRKKAA